MDTPPRQPLPDHIRSRPGMYVGGASAAGIRNIALFAIESLLDAPGACASHAVVTLLRDGWLSVEVAGAIPQVKAEDFTAECRDAAPPFMDLTIAAAMCDRLDVECICSGRRWSQSFSAGHPLAPPAFDETDAIDSFVNGQRTAPSGSHVLGLASAVREVVARDRVRLCWMAPSDEGPFGGLAVALGLRLAEPSWAGAIKWRLEGDRPRDLVYRMVTEQLPPLLAETGRAGG